MPHVLRIGTRGSPLALAQARMTAQALMAAHRWGPEQVEIVPITTTGDVIQDRPLAEVGGKALWTKELDRALIDGRTDVSVHSMKDVETIRPDALIVAAMLPRADVRDRLIGATSIAALPPGARVGTSSPRRAAQIQRARPDVEIVSFRGNVATRLARLERGEADATLLAAAGLDRLGLAEIGAAIDLLPAPSQGAVGIECLAARHDVIDLLRAVDHAPTHACLDAERALLAGLGGDCRSPVAALAQVDGGEIHLRAEIISGDGAACAIGEARFAVGDRDAPRALAAQLLRDAPLALAALFAGPQSFS